MRRVHFRPLDECVVFVVCLVILVTLASVTRSQGAPVELLPSKRTANAGGSSGSPGPDPLVDVIVKLEDEPVATYTGGVAGLAATTPRASGARRIDRSSAAVKNYRAYLARQHTAFETTARNAIPGTRTLYRYDMVIGGMALLVPAKEVARLASLPGVKGVYRSELRQPDTNKSPAFIGTPPLWTKLGGADDAGEGVIVGVLDTGIWPEHPSFSDPDPKGKAYSAPPGTFACQFSGGTNPGAPFACNGKLIGAYRFLAGYDACTTCEKPAEQFSSARDADGHGSHVASTAAGNRGVKADIRDVKVGTISGIAPRAHVIAYKVCGGPGGCPTSDSVAAIQQALLDGVDVINFSVAGGIDPFTDPVELAFLDAYAAGVFVAASAGNFGPGPSTVHHRGGWVTTVAASTEKRQFQSKITLSADNGDKLKLKGSSVMLGIKDPAPVALAASVGDDFCGNGTPDGAFTGMIVVCKRGGGIARLAKAINVQQRGAVGMLLFNDPADPAQGEPFTDTFLIPTVALRAAVGNDLIDFVNAHSGVTATFTKGAQAGLQADVIGSFSARGGLKGPGFGIAKPDLTAPGVQILAAETPQGFDPVSLDGELFQVITGTSMASPHVAGAGALLRDLHPSWTPGQIKSALMTRASTEKLVKEDGVTPFDPFDAGSGRILLKTAADPGITFDATKQDYIDHSGDLWNVNYPSIYVPAGAANTVGVIRTARSELAQDGTWTITAFAPPDVSVAVPAQISVPAGGSTPFGIGIDKSFIGPNVVRHARIELKHKSYVVTLPVTVVGSPPHQPSPRNEDLTTCNPKVIDSWVFNVAPGDNVDIVADTVDAATAADLCFAGTCPGGFTYGGDDEVACTFPPPAFSCPQKAFVAAGTGLCSVDVTQCGDNCASAATANYQLRVKRNGVDAAVALVGDDQ